MATYTVQAGDTLSGIAKKLGVSMSSLSGYKSGNPNLIYSGENLSYGGAAPTAAPAAPAGSVSKPLEDFAAKYKADNDALLAGQKAEQEGLFGQYETKLNSQEKLPDLYKRLSDELGIGETGGAIQGYKNEIYRVQGLLDRLNEDVTSRNLGTYATEAMRNRIVTSEGDQMRTQVSRLGTGMQPLVDLMTGAQGELSTMMPLYVQQQDKELSPIEMRINALGDRFAREITGFTSSREQDLTAVLDKLQRERQLSDRDWELAQQLASEERDYQRNLKLAKASAAASASYLPSKSTTGTVSTPSSATSLKQLPSVSSNLLSVQSAPSIGNIVQPAYSSLKLQNPSASIQGSGGYLQGSNVRL